MAQTVSTINNVLATESSRLGPEIYRKTVYTGPWQALVKQETWPEEMGDVITYLTYQRSLPDSKLNWTPIKAYTIGSDVQIASATNIDFATSQTQFGLHQTAVKSPSFDVNGLRHAWKRKEQLGQIFDILKKAVAWSWEERKRDEFIRNCQRKVVMANSNGIPESSIVPPAVSTTDSTFVANALAFPAVAATSGLTQTALDWFRMNLIRDGAADGALGMEDGAPVFGLICSPETSHKLLRQNSAERVDFNYAKPSELLRAMGVSRSHMGFYHLIDTFMPRYKLASTTISGNSSGTVITAGAHGLAVGDFINIHDSATSAQNGNFVVLTVPSTTTFTYASLAAPTVTLTSGNGATDGDLQCYVEIRPYVKTNGVWVLNPDYLNAAYEASIIWHEDVYKLVIPPPVTSPGGNTQFDPQKYRGDFKFLNVINLDSASSAYNPDGTWGHFRGVMQSGSKPVRPEYGYVIIHQRMGQVIDLVNQTNLSASTYAPDVTADRTTSADNNEVGET